MLVLYVARLNNPSSPQRRNVLSLSSVSSRHNRHCLDANRQHSGSWIIKNGFNLPALIYLLLLAYRSTLCTRITDWITALSLVIWPTLIGVTCVHLAGLAIGYVVIDLSLSPIVIIWFFRNLLFTIVAEELFFRTVIQSCLEHGLPGPHAAYSETAPKRGQF